MRGRTRLITCVALAWLWVAWLAGLAHSANGDCSQPLTDGDRPTAVDCLAILRIAVALRTCDPFPACICAPKGTLPTTASDALVCLKVAVGGSTSLACPCEATTTTAAPTTTTSLTTTTIPVTTTSTLPADLDGDGWTALDGDCCEDPADGCATPALVNPGAFDFAGDGFDDDCNGAADDGEDACDQGLASNTNDPTDYAKALDLCSETVEDAEPIDMRYGLVDAQLLLTDGTGTPAIGSRAIRSQFGGAAVQRGDAMAVISTGGAAATGQTNPNFLAFEPGAAAGTTSSAPTDWLAANGNAFPTAPGCPAATGTDVNDAVMLKLRVRVPTNARSLSVSANFLTAEFPEWVCSPFNDMFLLLLDSTAADNPQDENLAVYASPGGGVYPVGANLAFGNTGLFRQCRNGATGCGGVNSVAGTTITCTSTAELAGSGFDPPSDGCQVGDLVGGGTGWLTIRGNVTPGEIAELRFAIWDTSDPGFDSLVILDNLRWGVDPVEAGAGL